MPDSPLVTIITVVYNSEHLIEKTICSVINQTCSDYEYIIVDGGSKDNTVAIIRRYEESISKWISEPDQGIYDAMNKGLRMATGKYVWFINSGDAIYDSYVIEKLRDFSLSKDPDVMYGDTMLIKESGTHLGLRSVQTTRKLPESLRFKSMINGMVVSHQSFIPKIGLTGEYNLIYKCSADLDWVIRCLGKAETILNTQMTLSAYLIGGYSGNNQKVSWKERWDIYIRYYGPIATLWAHLRIIGRNVLHTISGKRNY